VHARGEKGKKKGRKDPAAQREQGGGKGGVRGAGGLGARAQEERMVPSLVPPHPRAAREMGWEVELGEWSGGGGGGAVPAARGAGCVRGAA
jgi:hypothetical protein